ncbi:hypothetical protein [Bosea sp. (in: a-proteobacteria)]|uniref:hypothetical protein n=1 Tax=Bosea sp. (in: a-proteobacteria) TaxID=1871050 RepID=UPI003569D398
MQNRRRDIPKFDGAIALCLGNRQRLAHLMESCDIRHMTEPSGRDNVVTPKCRLEAVGRSNVKLAPMLGPSLLPDNTDPRGVLIGDET